jgi:hypothetical protein
MDRALERKPPGARELSCRACGNCRNRCALKSSSTKTSIRTNPLTDLLLTRNADGRRRSNRDRAHEGCGTWRRVLNVVPHRPHMRRSGVAQSPRCQKSRPAGCPSVAHRRRSRSRRASRSRRENTDPTSAPAARARAASRAPRTATALACHGRGATRQRLRLAVSPVPCGSGTSNTCRPRRAVGTGNSPRKLGTPYAS